MHGSGAIVVFLGVRLHQPAELNSEREGWQWFRFEDEDEGAKGMEMVDQRREEKGDKSAELMGIRDQVVAADADADAAACLESMKSQCCNCKLTLAYAPIPGPTPSSTGRRRLS